MQQLASSSLLDIDLWYTVWKFGGYRSDNSTIMAGYVFQSFQVRSHLTPQF